MSSDKEVDPEETPTQSQSGELTLCFIDFFIYLFIVITPVSRTWTTETFGIAVQSAADAKLAWLRSNDSPSSPLNGASCLAELHTHPNLLALDVCVNPDDKRYFDSETDDISNLETSVLESPKDVQLWIKLAFKYLNQKEM